VYYLYILECADGTLYTGIATDLERRLEEHNSSCRGAKYTRTRRPVKLVYSERYSDRSSASKREYHIKKKMCREEKIQLIGKS
jgi:putative endonuclease